MATRLSHWLSVGLFASSMVSTAHERALGQCDYRATVLADNPVAYWRLGDSSVEIARDEVGPGPFGPFGNHPGAYIGAVQLGQAGALAGDADTCMFLNGSGGRMEVPDAPALNFVGVPFSIEAWARKSIPFGTCSSTCIRRIVDKSQAGAGMGYGLDLNDNSIRTLGVVSTGPGFGDISGIPYNSAINTWYHIVTVSTGDGSATTYVNGTAIGTDDYSSATPSNTNVRIGVPDVVDSDSVARFVGWIDEVALYNHALTAQQISTHYVAATTGLTVTLHPVSSSACPGNDKIFSVAASGVGILTYRWQVESLPLGSNIWNDLVDGQIPGGVGIANNSNTNSLAIIDTQAAPPVRFRCRVTNACGNVNSGFATLAVATTGDMNCDCTINGLDIAHFVQALVNPTGFTGCNILHGDINGDLMIDELDISGFASCSMAGICP